MDWRIQSLGSLESKSIHHAIYWSGFWLANMLWNHTNVLSVKHSYSKQPKLYSLCVLTWLSQMWQSMMYEFQQSWQKPNRPFIVSKTKPNIDVKDAENWQMPTVKPGQKWKWFTNEQKRRKKKGLSHTVTLPITGPCRVLQGRAQGGVPQSTRLPHLVPCCDSRHAIIPWHPPSFSGCDD